MPDIPSSPLRRAGIALLALGLALSTVVVAAPAANAAAQTYFVDSLTDDGVGNTLREAVVLANANNVGIDTITFTVAGTLTLTAGPITITDGVTIDGDGFSPTITRDNDQGIFVIDLDAGTPLADRNVRLDDLHLDGASPFTGVAVYVQDTVPLDTLTFSNSTVNDFDGAFEGGALRVEALTGGVEILGTSFSGNNATTQGGAISVSDAPDGVFISSSSLLNNTATNGGALVVVGSGQVSFIDATVTGNSSNNAGGAAYLSGNTRLQVTDSSFTNNHSTNNSGGAIHVSGGVSGVSVGGSSFTGNTADINGGAMSIVGVDGLNVTASVFTNNAADGVGGGLSIENAGIVDISDSDFTGNSAVFGGGVHFELLDGAVTMDTNVFLDNFAGLNGGGITVMNVTQSFTVSNSTFELNEAADTNGSSGGGIWSENIVTGPFLVQSSTFTRNVAGNAGVSIGFDSVLNGGVAGIANSTFFEEDPNPYAINVGNAATGSTLAILSNTIVGNGAVHVGNVNGDVRISNSIVDGEVNGPVWPAVVRDSGTGLIFIEWSVVTSPILLTSMSAGTGNQFSTDPQLGTLAFNGGLTNTMLPAAGSPAINSGDPAYAYPFTQDQRGVNRIALGRIDIGAVELQTLALAATGTDIHPVVPVGAIALLGLGMLLVARRRRAV